MSTRRSSREFYPNIQNPRARPSMARAILKAEGHEDAARRSRRDRAPANQFFKGARRVAAGLPCRARFDARRREVVGDDAACSAASSSRWRGH